MGVQKRTMLKTLIFNVVYYLYEVLYVIRRKTECNHFRQKMYIIRNLFRYVINPKERNIQVLRLDNIPFALQPDYIRLTAITYQSFGLDKNKGTVETVPLFFGRGDRI